MSDRQQVIHDREAAGHVGIRSSGARYAATAESRTGRRLCLPLVAPEMQIVDAGDVHQHLKPQLRRVAQCTANRQQLRRFDLIGHFIIQRSNALHPATQVRVDLEKPRLLSAHSQCELSYRAIVLVRSIFF